MIRFELVEKSVMFICKVMHGDRMRDVKGVKTRDVLSNGQFSAFGDVSISPRRKPKSKSRTSISIEMSAYSRRNLCL